MCIRDSGDQMKTHFISGLDEILGYDGVFLRDAAGGPYLFPDICGPFPVRTVDGFDLFITFTDDYSRCDYIYLFLRDRS